MSRGREEEGKKQEKKEDHEGEEGRRWMMKRMRGGMK